MMKKKIMEFKFTKEEEQAINKNIPMTQEIFDSIMRKRQEIGEELEDVAFQLMLDYPDFLDVTAQRICDELGIDLDEDLPDLQIWQN